MHGSRRESTRHRRGGAKGRRRRGGRRLELDVWGDARDGALELEAFRGDDAGVR
jgi:hypothetical protein